MKRIILTGCFAFTILLSSNVNAQTYAEIEKPADTNPWSIETIINANKNGINWNTPALRARYFLNNNWAVRLQLGIGDGSGDAMSEHHTYYEFADGTGDKGTLDINRMGINFQLGAEYHFLGTKKLDPYAAVGINFGVAHLKAKADKFYDGDPQFGLPFTPDHYAKGLGFDGEGGYNTVGGTIGLGTDFYFVESVYIGIELGIDYNAINHRAGEKTYHLDGTYPKDIKGVEPEFKESYIGVQSTLRIGWRF